MKGETVADIGGPLTKQDAEEILSRVEYWHYPFELPSGRTVPRKPGGDVRHELRRAHFFEPLLRSYGGSLAGKRVLDLGCCQGYWSFEAARAGAASCLGIDSSPAFIAEARALRTILGIDNCVFRQAHLEDDPWWLGIEPVDICLFLGLFYHLTDPIAVLRRAMALTREAIVVDTQIWTKGAPARAAADPPAGAPALILVRRNPHEPTTEGSELKSTIRTVPTVSALVALLEDGGFATVEVLQPQSQMPKDYLHGRRVSIIAQRGGRVADGDNAQERSSTVSGSANRSRRGDGSAAGDGFSSVPAGAASRDDDPATLPASILTLVQNWPSGPTIVGATGGSGSRVIGRILLDGGMFLGANRNAAEDSMPIAAFCDLWATVYAAQEGLFDDDEAQCLERPMARSFAAALADHFDEPEPAARPWGWKVPSTIYLLPFFHDLFPGLRFIHLVRDGRDIAFSDNQNQLVKFGLPNLGWREREERRQLSRRAQQPAGSIKLWSQANLAAADYAERELGDRYLRVRFEDICADPVAEVGRILDFAGLDGNAEEIALEEVEPPTTVGRWRDQEAKILRDLRGIGQEALERFGYQPD